MPRETFHPHRVVWTPETIARLWDRHASAADAQATYFSYHSGRSILRYVRRRIALAGRRVLDFGCGPGYFLEQLLAEGIPCAGLEFSPGSVKAVSERLAPHPLFRGVTQSNGVPVPLDDGTQDIVFLIEVVEHLPDDELLRTLAEARRLLSPGGNVVVTTPHREDLAANTFMCPECGCLFHRWQHVRSFTRESLAHAMAEAGFRQLACDPTRFGKICLVERLREGARRLLRPGYVAPHLVYIGERL